MLGTIAKCGVLDLVFTVPTSLACTPENAPTALRELGFISHDNDQIQFDNDPEYCLRQLHDGINEGSYLLLFLHTDDPKIVDTTFIERIKRTKNHELIPFPIEMTVADACVTNSTYTWFFKHNYQLLYMMNSY